MHNTLVQCTRCTAGCIMQIRNPVVCDTGQSSLSNKPLLVVEHALIYH